MPRKVKGQTYACTSCSFYARSLNGLKVHESSMHRAITPDPDPTAEPYNKWKKILHKGLNGQTIHYVL
jgi:hypothetical protein